MCPDCEKAEAELAEARADHHFYDRGRMVRTPREILDHINSDHPCCIGVGDAVAILDALKQARELLERAHDWMYGRSKECDEAVLEAIATFLAAHKTGEHLNADACATGVVPSLPDSGQLAAHKEEKP